MILQNRRAGGPTAVATSFLETAVANRIDGIMVASTMTVAELLTLPGSKCITSSRYKTYIHLYKWIKNNTLGPNWFSGGELAVSTPLGSTAIRCNCVGLTNQEVGTIFVKYYYKCH